MFVHQEIVGNVPADHGSLEEMDIVQVMDELRRVQEILGGRFAVFALLDVDHVHRRAGRTVIDARAAEFEILFRITRVKGDVARGDGQHVLDQCTREAESSILAEDGPGAGHDLDAGLRRVGKADLFQRIERRLVNPSDVGLRQRLVLSAGKARTDGADVFGKRRRTKRNARRPSAGPSRTRNCAFLSHHSSPNGAVVVLFFATLLGFSARMRGSLFQARTRSAFGSYIGFSEASALTRVPAISIS